MAATLQDLIARQARGAPIKDVPLPTQGHFGADSPALDKSRVGRLPIDTRGQSPVPHSFQSTPEQQAMPNDLAEVFAKIAELTARCDALLERNGVWTRYVTGGES
jgi:hypothetical protein